MLIIHFCKCGGWRRIILQVVKSVLGFVKDGVSVRPLSSVSLGHWAPLPAHRWQLQGSTRRP